MSKQKIKSSRVKLSTNDRVRESERIVIDMLPADRSERTWSYLEAEAREKHMSPSTLSRCLRRFTRLNLVARRVDDSTYPPSVYYSRADIYAQSGSWRLVPEGQDQMPFPMKFNEQYRLCEELDLVGDIVDRGEFKARTEGFYEIAVNVNLLFMKAALPVILYASLGGKGPYEFGPGELAQKESVDRYTKQLQKDSHDLADELLDVVLRPWVHKLLSLLWIFSSGNKEVLEEAGEPLLKEGIKALKSYDAALEPYRVELAKKGR